MSDAMGSGGQSNNPSSRNNPLTSQRASVFKQAHSAADTDDDRSALHHTLGSSPNQAAPGNHGHTDLAKVNHDHLIGSVHMWLGVAVPDGFLPLSGQQFDGLLYPTLALVIGETFGPKVDNLYRLPNMNGRSPIGVGAADSGSVGNNYALGQKWGHEAPQQHTHEQNAHNHGQDAHSHSTFINTALINARTAGGATYNVDSGGATATALTTATNQPTTATNQNSGTGDKGNVHPVFGLHFIVRAV